ncbi:hypothetical protein CHUAL_012917 [Chamberlinius hualienensis]
MITKEYRIVMPMTLDEYYLAQLYCIGEASKNESGGGEGIEIIHNKPFDNVELLNGKYTSGQYTYKIYHLASKVPTFVRMVVPKGCLDVHEESWNAFPYIKTVITNPDYMKEKFCIVIESIHCSDRGTQENPLELSSDKLKHREVVPVDIANDKIVHSDYDAKEDPKLVKSKKTGRGPLTADWIKSANPVMCAYKLVSAEFKWFGVQDRVEKFIQKGERRLFTNFHRQIFCWMDQWYGLTVDDVRKFEQATKLELDKLRAVGELRGTMVEDE